LQDSTESIHIKNFNDKAWHRLTEDLDLLKCYLDIEEIIKKLESYPSRISIEQEIKNLEMNFYNISRMFVKNIYIYKMIGNGENIGAVNSFIYNVISRKAYDKGIDSYSFIKVLEVIKICSSTLKSIRNTFPLSPGIFDYVIFDEASQIDLPSAAPALHREKNHYSGRSNATYSCSWFN